MLEEVLFRSQGVAQMVEALVIKLRLHISRVRNSGGTYFY